VRMGGEEEGERRGVGARSKILGRGRKKFISTEGEGRVETGGQFRTENFSGRRPKGVFLITTRIRAQAPPRNLARTSFRQSSPDFGKRGCHRPKNSAPLPNRGSLSVCMSSLRRAGGGRWRRRNRSQCIKSFCPKPARRNFRQRQAERNSDVDAVGCVATFAAAPPRPSTPMRCE
jgi:hypothetical protein